MKLTTDQGGVSALCQAVRDGIGDASAPPPLRRARADGREILEPTICSVDGTRQRCFGKITQEEIGFLHNENGGGAHEYPLRLREGLYFSETMTGAPASVSLYLEHVNKSLAVLADAGAARPMSFDELINSGRRLQQMDAAFAAAMIDAPLDAIHRCVGPDPSHPYSKITVCRTTFPVQIGSSIIWFFFEKFLVAYGYLDERGIRQSTVTPVHSHPLNFETVYFVSSGPKSRVTEREYELQTPDGAAIILPNGDLHPQFLTAMRAGAAYPLKARLKTEDSFGPAPNPRILDPFESEQQLRAHRDLISLTDGLFRPHEVIVTDDPVAGTSYFALDNYFGPTGRVFLFKDGEISVWQHADWDSTPANR
jgi:hypothetical protein